MQTSAPLATAAPPTLHTVCGRRITTLPEYYYPTPYQGSVIYFCTKFCLEAFQADPERFYLAHSRNAHLIQPTGERHGAHVSSGAAAPGE